MHPYADTPSQQARQFAATAAQDAAELTRRRADTAAHIRAAHQAKCTVEARFGGNPAEGGPQGAQAGAQNRRAERRALEATNNFAAIRTGTDYEQFVANLLTAANIPTVRVGGSGDYGADLLANTATGTAVIQCKFYTHPVGYDAVKEAYTAKAIYHATTAFVVSNAAFTTQARKAARQLGVILVSHLAIVERMKTL